jgi:hypothetical protein
MRDLRIELRGPVTSVRAVALEQDLPVTQAGGRSVVTLPSLGAYEVLIVHQ